MSIVSVDFWDRIVTLESDGKKVDVRKVPPQDRQVWRKLQLEKDYQQMYIRVGGISFSGADMFHNKAFAVYRLIWYFGSPEAERLSLDASCEFLVKYREQAFSILDEIQGPISIHSIHFVPEDQYRSHLIGEEKHRQPTELEQRLLPSQEIQDEITNLIGFLISNPVAIERKGKKVSI